MEFIKSYKEDTRPTVFLFSEPEVFPIYLLENLLSNLCRTVVFSNDSNYWTKSTSHIARNSNLIFDAEKNFNKYPKPDYFLLIELAEKNKKEIIKKALDLSGNLNAKGFVVVQEINLQEEGVVLPETLGLIGVDNLFGPRMEIDQRSRISQVIGSAIRKEKIGIYKDEKISPVFMGDAARQVVKWLFSFGPYGETVSITSNKVSLEDICREVGKIYPDFKYKLINRTINVFNPAKNKTYPLDRGNLKLLEETLLWFKNNTLAKVPPTKIKFKSKKYKKVVASLAATIAILVMPFFFILVSASLLYFSLKAVALERIGLAKFFINTSYVISNIANKESVVFGKIPLLGKLYRPASSFSYAIENVSLIGLRGFDLVGDVYTLSDNILNGAEYNLEEVQGKITSNLNYIETRLSFVEGEAKNYPNLYKKIDLTQIKKVLTNVNKVIQSLTDLLGTAKTKTYLVLFQNNMELRPTGGFIGSFALVSFTSGKLDEISVQDVYSADGQLKGHVEPPQPIREYLKEANWFLRDSNWDPDFSVSAQRAEWFLDKEIDIPVDGVIAIDLNAIKDFLQVIGPIYLNDYQTEVSYSNFYEKTQSQVEGNFFPGSTKKASFITALSKEMMGALIQNKDGNKSKLAKILYDNLEARHIQVFLHNNPAKEAFGNLNWDGSFNYQSCLGNCVSDLLSLVEANLGVNKANYYIERKYNLSVNLQEGSIKKNLLITYKNNANLAMGDSGIYKTYTRLMVPLVSNLEFVRVGNDVLQTDVEASTGRKELGFYFELLPGQTKTVDISWAMVQPLSLNRAGEYQLYIRKQAGTPDEPITVSYNAPYGVALEVNPGYNTLFAKDIYSKVTWKK